ncbi:MAG: ATP-dependent DNA helicase [Candidatus Woesebacteria bacterium GW2011_GWB1_38_8b]|uniref:DNA 3'-5' helicase n=1 Tax=Candidatus Woesebacteria bacterium GW2011_GWB1_38_8b TaxID=1618571 RepID=A0A0G0L6M5_9BACT|nr:MAG: ATP-dependent DNA helicase [Candidatus Woesebacteria bacterium GW2011_GWB1_38_8b]
MTNTDKLLDSLNDAQKKAVTYKNGPLLVLAGAGSGKTKVLTHRAAYFIQEKIAHPSEILLLTFTNKAAYEMKERIGLLTQDIPGFTGTFHSFCVKLLRHDGKILGIPPGFVIYDDEDQKDAVKEIINKLNLNDEKFKPSEVLYQISDAKTNMLGPLAYGEIAQGDWQATVFKIYLEYEKFLKESGALDFDDLLLKTVKLLDENKEIKNKWQENYKYVLVDEWQDTNKIQYKLTKLLVGDRKNLTAVGDAAQSIYSWRGADYRNINNLIKDYPEMSVINLERNYRSTQNILDAANSIIKKNSSHPVLSLWTDKKAGQKIKIYRGRSELDEAGFIISQIDNLITKGIEFNDIAVLYRTNAQSRVIEEALLHAGIPYSLVGGVKFYSRKEIKDVLSYLRLIANPKDKVSRGRIEKLGIKKYENFQKLEEELGQIENFTTLDLMDQVLGKTDYLSKYIRETEENLARLENIKELRSVAAEFPDLNEFLENVALIEAEQDENGKVKSRSSSDQTPRNCITLMTLHAAKGLEFGVVFIIGMEEGLFPHSRSLFDINQLEEERRLAYVGITRAKEILYLTYAGRRLYFGQKTSNPPSRFIIDIPEELLEGIEGEYLERNSFKKQHSYDYDAIDDFDDSINF